jgi:hypothetical protein
MTTRTNYLVRLFVYRPQTMYLADKTFTWKVNNQCVKYSAVQLPSLLYTSIFCVSQSVPTLG